MSLLTCTKWNASTDEAEKNQGEQKNGKYYLSVENREKTKTKWGHLKQTAFSLTPFSWTKVGVPICSAMLLTQRARNRASAAGSWDTLQSYGQNMYIMRCAGDQEPVKTSLLLTTSPGFSLGVLIRSLSHSMAAIVSEEQQLWLDLQLYGKIYSPHRLLTDELQITTVSVTVW